MLERYTAVDVETPNRNNDVRTIFCDFVHIVRHNYHRFHRLGMEIMQKFHKFPFTFRVKPRNGFVENEYFGISHYNPRYRDSSFLPARQLERRFVRDVRAKPHEA